MALKSDFITDPLALLAEAENIEGILRKKFNLSSARQEDIKAITDAYSHKPVIQFRTAVPDFSNLLASEGWKYGIYYFENPPKTGFYKMIDGKHIFIEVDQKYNSLSTYPITTAQEFGSILLDKNPGLTDSNIHIEGSEIMIDVPTMDHLEMPSSEWVYDADSGLVRSTSREYAFKLVVTNANSIHEGYDLGEKGSTPELEARASMEADNSREEERETEADGVVGDGATNLASKNNLKIDLADFSPKNMYNVFLKYSATLTEDGEFVFSVRDSSQENSFRSLNLKEGENVSNETQQAKEWAFVNMLWIDACGLSYENAAEAFENRDNQMILTTVMSMLRSGDRSADRILTAVAELETQQGVEIAYRFLVSLDVQAGFDIDLNNVKELSSYEKSVVLEPEFKGNVQPK